MSDAPDISILKEKLLKSQWPKCNQIANELYEIGSEDSKKALIEGLKAKRHHIRTASICALTKFQDVSLVDVIRPLLNDPAYETRTQADESIKQLTGEKA